MNYRDLPIILLLLKIHIYIYIIITAFETRTILSLISQPRHSCFPYLTPRSSDHFGGDLILLVKEMDSSAK
jgi:hypothetical protein